MSAPGPDQELLATFRELGEHRYEVAVRTLFGNAGVEALVKLLATVRETLKHVPYEMLTEGLEVVIALEETDRPTAEGGADCRHLEQLSGRATSGLTIAVTGPTTHRVWFGRSVTLTGGGPLLRYRYVHGQMEVIVADDGTTWSVNDSPWECGMATPTFSSLEQALERYVSLNRVPELCPNLASSWRDDARLAFQQKPEALMRDSLHLALAYSVTNATVRPELNQSKTKPVDIEVNWWELKRSAIIEIKWLGASGPNDEDRFTTSYTQSRAIDGLKQLAAYLDMRDATSPEVPVMGYLFVFDARRRNLTPNQRSISRDDGLYYAMSDPEYPEELLERADMGRPMRCFLEPVCA